MRAKLVGVFIVVLSLALWGCASKKGTEKIPEAEPIQLSEESSESEFYRYLNPLTYLDAGNQFMIEMTGLWSLGMGTVEYSGEKSEETFEYLGDLYQSL